MFLHLVKIEDQDISSTHVRNSTYFTLVPLGSIRGDVPDLQCGLV